MLKFEEIQKKVTKEILEDYYIAQDNGYYDTIKHFGLTDWTFNKLLDLYGIKKDRHLTSKRGNITKYKKAGGKDEYDKKLLEKRNKTKIEKYGSIEAFNAMISNKCANTWNLKSDIDKKEHAQLVMEHGGGWNKETIKQTLINKYGVDNAYKLGNNYNCSSKVNSEFAALLDNHNITYSREFYLNNFRYDFKIDNTLVELDPWPFHNSSWNPLGQETIDKFYHKRKTENANEYNYNCIHIFDWEDQSKIISLFYNREKVYARKCRVKEVEVSEAKNFLYQHHLQNYAKDSIRVGLFYNDELVSIMTFGKPRYNKNYEYELVRYCSSKKVIGGAEKLFKYFINKYNPSSIISYCDCSKFKGDVYKKLGFKYLRKSSPAKHWFNIKTKRHITDNLLRQRGFDQLFGTDYGKGTSNEQLMIENGFVEIYDCGQATYIWKKVLTN